MADAMADAMLPLIADLETTIIISAFEEDAWREAFENDHHDSDDDDDEDSHDNIPMMQTVAGPYNEQALPKMWPLAHAPAMMKQRAVSTPSNRRGWSGNFRSSSGPAALASQDNNNTTGADDVAAAPLSPQLIPKRRAPGANNRRAPARLASAKHEYSSNPRVIGSLGAHKVTKPTSMGPAETRRRQVQDRRHQAMVSKMSRLDLGWERDDDGNVRWMGPRNREASLASYRSNAQGSPDEEAIVVKYDPAG